MVSSLYLSSSSFGSICSHAIWLTSTVYPGYLGATCPQQKCQDGLSHSHQDRQLQPEWESAQIERLMDSLQTATQALQA